MVSAGDDSSLGVASAPDDELGAAFEVPPVVVRGSGITPEEDERQSRRALMLRVGLLLFSWLLLAVMIVGYMIKSGRW